MTRNPDEIPLNIVLESDLGLLIFSGKNADPLELVVTNNDARVAEEVRINIVRADLLPVGNEYPTETLVGGGQKIIEDGWAEMRAADLDPWQVVDDWDNPLSLGPLGGVHGLSKSFKVRLNIPSNNTDSGRMCFAIMISAKPAMVPVAGGIVIDQDDFSVAAGAEVTATATITGETGFEDAPLWSSSDSAVFVVDQVSGVITGVSEGKAALRVASHKNPALKASRFVLVTPAAAAELIAWYDASDTATIVESGGLVSQLQDKTGNLNHLNQSTAGNKPLTGATTQNSLNVIDFVDDFLSGSGFIPTGSEPVTILMLFKGSAASAGKYQVPLHCGNLNAEGNVSNAHIKLVADWDNELMFDSYAYNISQAWTPGAWTLAAIRHDASNMKLMIDGLENTRTTVFPKNTQGNSIRIGAGVVFPYSQWYLVGSFAEAKIYAGLLTDGELATKSSEILTKWGL